LPASAKSAKPADNAHYLSGELKNERFDDLAGYLALHEQVVLDFAAVRRLDFFSAGQLVNRLTPIKNAGREVIIRSPNHLVAELMAVVGLNRVARILVPKS
jgi:anti-anti-sigma regulatory factor